MSFPEKHKRRFNSYPDFYKQKFGGRVQKLSVNAGYSCPNRDGTKGTGGCSYCNNISFSPAYCHQNKSVTEQLQEGMAFVSKRYPRSQKYLAYFQNYSNTYAPVEQLEHNYREALAVPGIVGLIVSTRPDCLPDDVMDLLEKINQETFLKIELGIESTSNKALKNINRGHNFEDSKESIFKLHHHGILVAGHLIFGLPGESRNQMLQSSSLISSLPLHSIKFRQLQIIKGSPMAATYQNNPGWFHLFELEEYISFICDFTERLNPGFIIERFSGESPSKYLIAPRWKLKHEQVLDLVEKELYRRNSWQGIHFSGETLQFS